MARPDHLGEDARELQPGMTELRHQLHRRPEIGLQLPETQRAVLGALEGLPLEISTGTSCTSVTAVLRGTGGSGTVGSGTGATSRPGPAVLLRGDMDALPVHEETGVEFASEVSGVMHACGHDLHTGMLAEGVLAAAGPPVARAYGIHVIAGGLPRGQFATRPGTLMASSDGLMVTVNGVGGHGSAPDHAKDPVSVAAEMVVSLQTMVTRQFSIFDPVVVTVGSFHAGTKRNIIPPRAAFEATIRTFSAAARERMQAASVRLCEGIAAAHGLTADVRYLAEYPVTVNDGQQAAFASAVAAEVFGADRVTAMANPDPGAEDFSRVLEQVPGCYLFLGACPADDYEAAEHNHSPAAAFDDSVLADGCLLHASLAIRALQDLPRPA